MKYIEKYLQQGKVVRYIAKLHLFLFVQPIISLLIGAILASSPK